MSITIYPIPRLLATNPYLDLLYAPFAAWPDVQIARQPFAQTLRHGLLHGGQRVLHWHFFDELTQQPNQAATALRSISFIALLRLLALREAKLVWTAHNLEPHELRYPQWAQRCYQAMAQAAGQIIVHSQPAAQLLDQRYQVATKTQVIAHGSYIGVYGEAWEQAAARKHLQLTPEGFVALNLGTLRPYKGVELLLEAWSAELGRLLIVGAAKDQRYAEQLQQQATNPSITLRPQFIADSLLPAWFAAADVVVLPYRKTLTSGMLLAALSYAAPVVAPDLPPVRELIRDGENGFLFEVNNAASLRAALQRAAAHPDRQALRQNALQTVQALDWGQIANQTAAVYRRLFEKPA
ncbi:glycosyltransferase family 4 protein [Herpetosiphon sp.]|uniref:Glycosyl transferase group 1 n=1 Tax=Herpetosiphon aurantiacus (strain ATCC 23779 / DSM 785 / 114-95) TaxID=316274 RepID=A9AXQ5_HERA2|nr:glycosyltransferase family 4 protein [Herpetosiphon sp.]ABX03469.1 glycosyl transferase group 1 [Herpetosiphon aurantiacus DSM 785]